ncbi:hypothetical protein [Bradyrhizobium sp. I71]|uniref:hypothetical protein n=1 Tax=Bradyrhizobium sp. I71 TaxID=2590772 RepID=UPI001EF9ACA3|nr:hypothetical protein [Bradyrhizobium sp. I71]ULK98890.1 hypothetical protein FJV43_03855 [Bradyrhizobium sp. I71]
MAILFVGGAAIFAMLSLDKVLTENKRLDTLAQQAGFADNEEMQSAQAAGFSEAGPYRAKLKADTEAKPEQERQRAEAAARAKAAEEADKKVRQARFEQGSMYAIALKKSMKNPDSFKLEVARRTDDGIFCFEYRAANSFNAIIPGKALFGAGKAATSDQAGFAPLWNKHCTKPAERFETIVYAMKNGYF